MPTYTVTKGKSVTSGSVALFTLPAFTVPAGEEFKSFKITIPGADKSYTGYRLYYDSANIGFNTSSTDTASLHWTNGGTSSVWLTSSTSKSVTVVVTFTTKTITSYTITTQVSGGNGTLTANKSTAAAGDTITLTPSPNVGYELASLTNNRSVTITNNKFTMPANNITVTATFQKKSYSITKSVSPTGGGSISTKISGTEVTTGKMGDTVTITATPASGYTFKSWLASTGVTPASLTSTTTTFTMPANTAPVYALFNKYSTGTLSTKSMTGGGTVTLTISADKSTYSHKYTLSFGTGMATSETTVAAGTTSVSISVPLNWSAQIPNATSKTGGTLTLKTYEGSTLIGTSTITGLTYNVPASVKPSVSALTTAVARTIGGTTYANVGSYYVQNHSGVSVSCTASGSQSSTISSVVMTISGYSGSKTMSLSSGTYSATSNLLSVAGTATITVTATDSRGRTGTNTATITVTAYSKPAGTLNVYRVDANGDADDMGEYGKYQLTKSYTAVGSNSLTVKITSKGSQETVSADTGNLLPSTRQSFDVQYEYTVTLTLVDSFNETTTITDKLQTAKYIIHVDAGGDKLGFMKAANKTIPTGKTSTVEFSADSQIYYGDLTLEDMIGMWALQSVGTVVTSAVNFNDLLTPGIYSFRTNAIASSSTNSPSQTAGKLWVYNANGEIKSMSQTWAYMLQKYVDLTGAEYYRSVQTAGNTTIIYSAWTQR